MPTEFVVLDCARMENPSVATIGYVARLRLELRRGGRELRLAHAGQDLRLLIELAGLAGVLGVEVQRQSEQREQLRGVEEEGELGNPPL